MKKIISALIIFAMLCSALFAAIPAFADVDEAKAALESVVNDADRCKEVDYTQATWDPFAAALANAKALIGEQYPDEAELVAAKAALEEKKAALKEITLDDLYDMVEIAKEIEKEGFSDATWNALQNAIEDAENFCEDNADEIDVSDFDLKEYYSVLKKALGDMKYDTSALNALIGKAKLLYDNSTYAEKLGYGSDYTKETYDPFVAAYNKAKEDVKSNDYDLITASTAALDAALAALDAVSVPDDLKTNLADLMDLADVLIPEEWSEAAWKMVEMKVEQANDAKNNVKVSTYVKAVKELEQALMNLTNEDKQDKDKLPERPVVDTSYLDDLIKWCDDNLVESGYDADSWRKISEALTAARAVSENPRKAETVKAAYDRLLKAKNELVAVEGAAGDGSGDDAEGGCGGFIATTFVVMSATLALGATVVLRKKED